jgi:tetratricopeptide (TPR) repeat protein
VRKFFTLTCALVSLAFAGCAVTTAVRAPTLLPARIPVRSYPVIWVSGGALAEEQFLQDRLAAHLADDGQHEVRRVDLAELEPARKAGQIAPSTVVVLVDLAFDERVRSDWATTSMQMCGYYGCYTSYQSTPVSVAELRGEAVVTVYEGPTARVLQEERFQRHAYGDDYAGESTDALLEALAREIEHAVDVLRKRERVEFYRSEVPGVNEALELFKQGKWDEGRTLLEQAKDKLGDLDKEAQARVWFNLGLARWYAPGTAGLTDEAYRIARRALLMALKLERHPVHVRTLSALDRARKSYALLEEQRAARAHNYAIYAREAASRESAPEPGEVVPPPSKDAPVAPAAPDASSPSAAPPPAATPSPAAPPPPATPPAP